MSVPVVDRSQVLAWRLSASGLDVRRPREQRAESLHPVGLRTGGGRDAALVAWHARAEGADAGELAQALTHRRWVDAPTVRGTRVLDPADLPALTVGALPPDDAAVAARLRRRASAAGLVPGELLRTAVEGARAALAERPRSTAELSRLVTEAVPAQASAFCRACDAVHVDNGLFSMVGLAVAWVRASGLDDERYVRPDLWLDQSDPPVQADAAARLLAWHLRAHSPTTPAELAAYLAIGRVEAEQRWEQAPELAEVEHGGRRAWVPAADLEPLRAARLPDGVRLLPPYDSFLDGPDRGCLVPDPTQQREVWRPFGNPGLALVDGVATCTWRATRRGARLDVRLVPLDGWRPAHLPVVSAELAAVAGLRGLELGGVESA